jgi:hypothetical protein
MKKIIEKIKCWLFRMWMKKQVKKAMKADQAKENLQPPTFSEFNEHLSDSDKKNLIKNFNHERSIQEILGITNCVMPNPKTHTSCEMPHPKTRTCVPILNNLKSLEAQSSFKSMEVLSETYRAEKPIYNNMITEEYVFNNKTYRLTKKQLFFLVAAEGQNTSGPVPIDLHQICNEFLMQKYPKVSDYKALSKDKFKPKYHKKTIRSLVSLRLFDQIDGKWYLAK